MPPFARHAKNPSLAVLGRMLKRAARLYDEPRLAKVGQEALDQAYDVSPATSSDQPSGQASSAPDENRNENCVYRRAAGATRP
jgi:hypothetical protein